MYWSFSFLELLTSRFYMTDHSADWLPVLQTMCKVEMLSHCLLIGYSYVFYYVHVYGYFGFGISALFYVTSLLCFYM